MKEKLFILTSILFILITVSLSGCIDNHGTSTKTFENKEISFNYSSAWVTFSDFWPSNFGSQYNYSLDENLNATDMVGVLDPESETSYEKFSISVMIKTRPGTGNLKETFDSTYDSVAQQYNSTFRAISERTLNLDGVIAYEKVYQIPHGEPYYQIREIWLEKNNKIYIISCKSFPSNYNESQNDFNIIINSFHVK